MSICSRLRQSMLKENLNTLKVETLYWPRILMIPQVHQANHNVWTMIMTSLTSNGQHLPEMVDQGFSTTSLKRDYQMRIFG